MLRGVIGFGAGLVLSLAVFGGSITAMVYGIPGWDEYGNETYNKLEGDYRKNPETGAALEYYDISNSIDDTVDSMNKSLLFEDNNVVAIRKPSNSEMQREIEGYINDIKDLSINKNYAMELVDICTRIDNLDKEYITLPDLESKAEYGKQYKEITDELDGIGDGIYDFAYEIQPDLEKIMENISTIEEAAYGCIAGVIISPIAGVIFGIYFTDSIEDYKNTYRYRRRRNKP